MINLSIFAHAINMIVCLLVAWQSYSIYRQYPATTAIVRDFAMMYLMFALYFLNLFLPQALFNDLLYIGWGWLTVHVFLILASGFLALAPLHLYSASSKMRRAVFFAYIAIAFIEVVIQYSTLKPVLVEMHQGYAFIRGDFPSYLRLGIGLVTLITGLFTAFSFIGYAAVTQQPLLKRKYYLIGMGVFILMAASMFAFFLTPLLTFFGTPDAAFAVFLANTNAVPGSLLVLFGLMYRYREIAEITVDL